NYDVDDLSSLLAQGRISRRQFVLGALGLGISLGTADELIRAAEASAAPKFRVAQGGSLTCGVVNAVGKFDPHGWSGFTSTIATNHIYQGLVRLNFNTTPIEP